jgi:NH3-dependent NAD+ synthetase
LEAIIDAKPTAELEPSNEEHTQTDEEDMGFTYDELGIFAKLRNVSRCGPVSMYQTLEQWWSSSSSSNSNSTSRTTVTTSNTNESKSNEDEDISEDGAIEDEDIEEDDYKYNDNEPGGDTVHTYLSPSEIAAKVKYFFKMYGINRHKQKQTTLTLTPSYHAQNYSPGNRQFLYPNWKRQFNTIDTLVAEDEKLLVRKKTKQKRSSSSIKR